MVCVQSGNTVMQYSDSQYRNLESILEKTVVSLDDKINELSLIRTVSEKLLQTSDIEKACRLLLKIVQTTSNCDNCSLMLLVNEQLTLRAAAGNSDSTLQGPFHASQFPIGMGIAGTAASEKTLIRIDDTNQDSRFLIDSDQTTPVRSLMCIPLIKYGHCIGVLNISAADPNAFTSEHERMLVIIAGQAAVILANFELQNNFAELQKVQEALHASEERYALAEKVSQIGSWDWNILTGEIVWSQTIEPMFGFARGQFGGTYDDFLVCLHPDDTTYVQESIKACVENDEFYDIEHRIICPDKSIRWLSETGNVIRDDTGRAVRMLGIVQDITYNKEIRKHVQQLATAVEQATDTIIITDANGDILFVNPAFEMVTGYDKTEVIGHNTRFLKSDAHSARFYKRLWDTINSGKVWRGDIVNTIKSGHLIEVEMTIAPVLDEHNTIINYIAIQRDITERKRLENEVAQLRRDQELFLRHELQNKIATVSGYTQLLTNHAMAQLDDKSQKYLSIVSDTLTTTITLIDRIKLLHDFEIGTAVLNTKPHSLPALVTTCMGDMHVTADEHDTVLQLDNQNQQSFTMLMDKTLLAGVFHNLLKNAIEHVSQEKDPTTRIVTVGINHSQDVCHVAVNNGGPTVPPGKLAVFFDKFNTGNEKQDGMGLGTTYAYLVTKAHGGQIKVTSNETDGTTVTVTFPVQSSAE
jgi:two-component system, cell cycle sensor histidine kinase and response regulator CckA